MHWCESCVRDWIRNQEKPLLCDFNNNHTNKLGLFPWSLSCIITPFGGFWREFGNNEKNHCNRLITCYGNKGRLYWLHVPFFYFCKMATRLLCHLLLLHRIQCEFGNSIKVADQILKKLATKNRYTPRMWSGVYCGSHNSG